MYQLVTTDDLGRRMVFPIVKIKTVLGRDATCDIVLDDPEVSRQHTKIYIINDRMQIKDMQSSNGTFLNSMKVEKMCDLAPGDQIIIGPNLFMLEQVENAREEEIELTCILTVRQLRELAGTSIPERPRDEDVQGEATMIGTKTELMAGIYHKKLGLAKHPSLELIFGVDQGRKFLLPFGEYTVGRSSRCNIHLQDEKISSIHGTFISSEEGVTYRDDESLNGSILNNRNVKIAKLNHRDILMFGRTKLRYFDPKRSDQDIVSNKPIRKYSSPRESAGIASNVIDFIAYYWYVFAGAAMVFFFLGYLLVKG